MLPPGEAAAPAEDSDRRRAQRGGCPSPGERTPIRSCQVCSGWWRPTLKSQPWINLSKRFPLSSQGQSLLLYFSFKEYAKKECPGTLLLLSFVAAKGCPKICHCSDRSGMVVQCTSRNLENVPANLPRDTVVLLLSSNRIRHIPKEAFADLQRLRELDLSHNLLESMDDDSFLGVLDSLRTLDLSNNQLSGLPRGTFVKLHARIRLSNNPWHCECSLQEVLRELRLDPETVNDVSCHTSVQEEYVGQPVIQVLDSGINFCNFHHKTTDVAMFVAMFCWFFMVTAYIVYYIKHNQDDARRHMEYLKSLPSTSHISKDYDTASSVF